MIKFNKFYLHAFYPIDKTLFLSWLILGRVFSYRASTAAVILLGDRFVH